VIALEKYGYWGVALIIALESMGVPVPGETALVAAALYAGKTQVLNIWVLIAFASAGAILGDNIGYWIGREIGFLLVIGIIIFLGSVWFIGRHEAELTVKAERAFPGPVKSRRKLRRSAG
jgi:hypothetical protein